MSWALVLTVAPICVSIVVASFVLRGTRVSERTDKINRDRRRDELKPEWDHDRCGIFTRDGYARVYELVLVLRKGDLHSVTVTIDQSWPSFVLGTPGVHPSNLKRAEFGPLHEGGEAAWQVELGPIGEARPPTIRLELKPVAGEDAWTQVMTINTPVQTLPMPYPDEQGNPADA
ncbi:MULTISPECIES: hypothetical protein [Nocardia]|uniref:hypothetical protein n=1 Tax=Nocardia TaxID=1817 RepID=UPI0024543700|nr:MULTISPECIES: hypothetical protein [Nocardia]